MDSTYSSVVMLEQFYMSWRASIQFSRALCLRVLSMARLDSWRMLGLMHLWERQSEVSMRIEPVQFAGAVKSYIMPHLWFPSYCSQSVGAPCSLVCGRVMRRKVDHLRTKTGWEWRDGHCTDGTNGDCRAVRPISERTFCCAHVELDPWADHRQTE